MPALYGRKDAFMKYRCIIAEDNPVERAALELMLEQTGMAEIVALCADGLEAFNALKTTETDIVFSDVDMPNLNGFGLVKSLTKQPVFIFTTAHSAYAAESYEIDVADFIVKPVTLPRLLRSLQKAAKLIESQKDEAQILSDSALELPVSAIPEGILVRAEDLMIKIALHDIAYIESAGNFTKIYTMGKECHSVLVNIKNLVLQLPLNYLQRTHRGFMVNPMHIKALSSAVVILSDNRQIPLSPQYREQVTEAMHVRHIKRLP